MSAKNCERCGKPQKLIGPRCECGEPDGRAHCAVASGSARCPTCGRIVPLLNRSVISGKGVFLIHNDRAGIICSHSLENHPQNTKIKDARSRSPKRAP